MQMSRFLKFNLIQSKTFKSIFFKNLLKYANEPLLKKMFLNNKKGNQIQFYFEYFHIWPSIKIIHRVARLVVWRAA